MASQPTLRIAVLWLGGIVDEADRVKAPPEPVYTLEDAATGRALAPDFTSCIELEAFIRQNYPRSVRQPQPSAPAEEVTRAEKLLALHEHPPADFDTRHLRSGLAGQFYQWEHAPQIRERLRCALGLPDWDD